ncbi:MAG: hypothetical protein AB3N18_00950 [Allomuricauda sp.]
MLFKIKSYSKFLFKSTNQHGVHSPFVFNYVTKCLYSKKRLDFVKSIDVLLKSIDYFGFKNIQILNNPELQKKVEPIYPTLIWAEDNIDILYTNNMDVGIFDQLISTRKIHNNSMIFVDEIHSSKSRKKNWEKLTQKPTVTVSIDMFHCGVLFIRKEQVKEHFNIRI